MPPRPLAELPPSSWPKNPHYGMDLVPLPFRVRAVLAGETVIDSNRAQVMFELGHAPVYYFPKEEVRLELARRNDHATHCPYKGDAAYWSMMLGGQEVENIFWCYEDPYPEMAALKDLIGVYWDKIDVWYHGEQRADAPVEIAGRVNASNNFARCYPDLCAQWHPDKNERIQPYEFAAESPVVVWWRDGRGEEWEEAIRDRVLKTTVTDASD